MNDVRIKLRTGSSLVGRVLLALVVSGAPVGAQALAEELWGQELWGTWQIDVEASMADLPGLTRWQRLPAKEKEREGDRLRSSLERRAPELRLVLADDEVKMASGPRQTSFPCSVRYRSETVVLFACPTAEPSFTMTAVPMPEGRLKLLSSNTDDMDVYVWSRVEDSEGTESSEGTEPEETEEVGETEPLGDASPPSP